MLNYSLNFTPMGRGFTENTLYLLSESDIVQSDAEFQQGERSLAHVLSSKMLDLLCNYMSLQITQLSLGVVEDD